MVFRYKVAKVSSFDMDLVQECVLHLQSLRQERLDLDEKTQELEKEKLDLQRLLEEQQLLQPAGTAPQAPRRIVVNNSTRGSVGSTAGAAETGQFLQLRRELHKVQAKVNEVEENLQIQESKDSEKMAGQKVLSNINNILCDNVSKLEAEQGALAQMLQVVKGFSDTMSVSRADMENITENLNAATGRAEKEVWRRSLKEDKEEQHQAPAAPSWSSEATERHIEEKLEEKTAELQGLNAALKQSNELVSEMKKCHISSVSHEREVELEAEIRMVEEEWQREKEELQVELQDIIEMNKELEKDVQKKKETI